MKIFIVTDGCYSDYHIVAVFTKESAALDFVSQNGGNIEEYKANALAGAIKRKNYRCLLPEMRSWDFEILAKSTGRVSPLNGMSKAYKADGIQHAIGDSLVSPEHARKLAEEKLQAALRDVVYPKSLKAKHLKK